MRDLRPSDAFRAPAMDTSCYAEGRTAKGQQVPNHTPAGRCAREKSGHFTPGELKFLPDWSIRVPNPERPREMNCIVQQVKPGVHS